MKPKEFIKALYSRIDVISYEQIKEIIETQFPGLVKEEPKFKNGDIIQHECMTTLVLITIYEHSVGNGFWEGDFMLNHNGWNFNYSPKQWKKVSLEVWKERLIEECKKRGIWDTKYIITVVNEPALDYGEQNIGYDPVSDKLWSRYGLVYKKGVFATPLETITKEEAEKQLGKKIID